MKYDEKIRLITELFRMISSGKSDFELTEKLTGEGVAKIHHQNLIFSAHKKVQDDLLTKLVPMLHNGQKENVSVILSKYADDTKEALLQKGVESIKSDIRKGISKRLKSGASEEDVIKEFSHEYFPDEAVIKQVSHFRDFNEAPKGVEKIKFLSLGGLLTFVGTAVLFYKGFDLSGKVIGLMILTIAMGLWNFYKAFIPPGVAKLSSFSDRFDKH